MKISIVIPVWNGAAVIRDCLNALLEQVKPEFCEIICVDNGSSDESVSLITDLFPQVRLLSQPVNLGFAGGVNAGIEAAKGDAFVLLNQDCIIQPGWLDSLLQALESNRRAVFGSLILNPDGSIDHFGARIQRPEAVGVHITEINSIEHLEYVSGASFAFHRRVWETVGKFDEGFYPAYYEDADYCFRARRLGVKVLCVPQARVVHLRSNEDWRVNPSRHKANYHAVRYRFACKHFAEDDLKEFIEAEKRSITGNDFLDTLGRAIAARRTLFLLHEIVKRRGDDLGERVSSTLVRQMKTGLGEILQQALAQLVELEPSFSQPLQEWSVSLQNLRSLQYQEYHLLERIYFRSPTDQGPEPWFKRAFRLFVLRPISFLIGRDYLLLAQLNTLHVMRMDRMDQMMAQMGCAIDQVNYRLKLLGLLMSYDAQQ